MRAPSNPPSNPLSEAYRILALVITFAAAILFGLAMHMGTQGGCELAGLGILLGIGASRMVRALGNPPFSCLVGTLAIVVIVIVAIL